MPAEQTGHAMQATQRTVLERARESAPSLVLGVQQAIAGVLDRDDARTDIRVQLDIAKGQRCRGGDLRHKGGIHSDRAIVHEHRDASPVVLDRRDHTVRRRLPHGADRPASST